MSKTCSIQLQQLFVDFVSLRKQVLERVRATTSCKTPPELINFLQTRENNEFSGLKERARSITPGVSLDYLLSGAWWKEQGVEYDLSFKIVP